MAFDEPTNQPDSNAVDTPRRAASESDANQPSQDRRQGQKPSQRQPRRPYHKRGHSQNSRNRLEERRPEDQPQGPAPDASQSPATENNSVTNNRPQNSGERQQGRRTGYRPQNQAKNQRRGQGQNRRQGSQQRQPEQPSQNRQDLNPSSEQPDKPAGLRTSPPGSRSPNERQPSQRRDGESRRGQGSRRDQGSRRNQGSQHGQNQRRDRFPRNDVASGTPPVDTDWARSNRGPADRPEGQQFQIRQPAQPRRKGQRQDSRSTYTRIEYDRPAPTTPIRTNRGIKARGQGGAFSKNWWARRWIEAMEQLVDPMRLQRGRSYARTGQVLSISETPRGIEAAVQGSRPQPYKVQIQVTALTDEQWDKVIDALSEQALFTAQLLAGEMPENIEDAFQSAGVSLFPDTEGDLHTECSCPDWANPCKHVAACHYILGDRFDDDPFLLFRMRGRSQEQILQALRARRAGSAEPEEDVEVGMPEAEQAAPLEDAMDHFWEPIDLLESFPLTIRPPTVETPLLKRLGEPSFLSGETLQGILRPVYNTFTRSALRAAYSEEEPMESNGADDNGSGYSDVIDGSDSDTDPEE